MVGPPVAGRIGRSAGASQHDAAASGLRVQHRLDGRVTAEVVGEALEHGVVAPQTSWRWWAAMRSKGQLRSRMVPSASS
jgi:hypothetical protein